MEHAGQEPGRRLNRNGKGKLGIIIAGVVVLCLLGGYCMLCALGQPSDRALPHTRVMGIDVGDKTTQQISQVLSNDLTSQAEDRSVVFCVTGEENFTVDVPADSIRIDCGQTAAKAMAAGKGEGFFRRGAVFLHCLKAGQDVTPVISGTDQLDSLLTDMDEQISKPVEESSWFVGETQLEITKGTPGYRVDREAVKKSVLEMLAKGDTVKTGTVTPQFTTDPVYVEPQPLDFQKMYDSVHVLGF